MGCSSSKDAVTAASSEVGSHRSQGGGGGKGSGTALAKNAVEKIEESPNGTAGSEPVKPEIQEPEIEEDALFQLLVSGQERTEFEGFWASVYECLDSNPKGASYQHHSTTPLHLACRLVDCDDVFMEEENSSNYYSVITSIRALIKAFPDAVGIKDANGFIPLHYVLSPPPHANFKGRYKIRADVLRGLVAADFDVSYDYFAQTNVLYDQDTGGCTPLYHVLQHLPDDINDMGPTVEYVSVIQECNPRMVCVSNDVDQDKPLALLYRRFTRQFDLSEKFFGGDNSRPEVVQHRREYKMAARNTWKIIELLLSPESLSEHEQWRLVHRAIQVETPPDLLRYIVETNSEDLTQADEAGNLPIHYAAKSTPKESQFPAFYTKYVVDELLYKFPEAASIRDGNDNFPLALAVGSGKQWIGGGVKSLYDAYPQALDQIDLDDHPGLKKVLSFNEEEAPDSESPIATLTSNGVIKDEHHDAIMLVQRPDVDISEVVSAMWAHEEDAGVQTLGCMAVYRLAGNVDSDEDILRLSLSSIAAVVNAMKAHPNEPVVQDKACLALRSLATADGKREVSFVASGAIAAVVGAMQAHVRDSAVQEEACGAIADIVAVGGSDRATIVASVSGLTAIVNAIASHPTSEGVQREGLQALNIMTDHPNANLPDLPRSQMESLLEHAKTSFPDSCSKTADMLLLRLSS